MAILELSGDKKWAKIHSGVLYLDNFTSPLAGRYTVLEEQNPADGWQIVDAALEPTLKDWNPSSWWAQCKGTMALRVRHNPGQPQNRIMNDEFPDPYKLDSLGRDYPWFTCRIGSAAETIPVGIPGWPNGFPYDWSWGGMDHKIQYGFDTDKYFAGRHMHRCGILSTWVYTYYDVDTANVSHSQLVNLMWQFWYINHHITPEETYFSQGEPAGWSVGSDAWVPGQVDYGSTSIGKFGFNTSHCTSYSVDSYTYFHGLAVCETNYVTVTNIPPNPIGDDAIPGWPEGRWMFRVEHPEIGVMNQTMIYPEGDSTIYMPMFDNNQSAWEKVECYIDPPSGGGPTVKFTEFAPTDFVNGGDIYCFDALGTADVTCVDETAPPIPEEPICYDDCQGGIFVDTDECESGIYPCVDEE